MTVAPRKASPPSLRKNPSLVPAAPSSRVASLRCPFCNSTYYYSNCQGILYLLPCFLRLYLWPTALTSESVRGMEVSTFSDKSLLPDATSHAVMSSAWTRCSFPLVGSRTSNNFGLICWELITGHKKLYLSFLLLLLSRLKINTQSSTRKCFTFRPRLLFSFRSSPIS